MRLFTISIVHGLLKEMGTFRFTLCVKIQYCLAAWLATILVDGMVKRVFQNRIQYMQQFSDIQNPPSE